MMLCVFNNVFNVAAIQITNTLCNDATIAYQHPDGLEAMLFLKESGF